MSRGGDARASKKGLQVGHSCGAVKFTRVKAGRNQYERVPDAWYVYCWATDGKQGHAWRPILGLAFIRQRDAARAAQSLMAAGFDTYDKLRVADAMTVKAVATEHLQW